MPWVIGISRLAYSMVFVKACANDLVKITYLQSLASG
jgi:hypothetical protein